MRRERATTGEIRIGISGWRYAPWRKVFYPAGLPQRDELAFAAAALRTVEINGSFYSLQRPSSYLTWHAATPPGFVFAVKGGKFLTHAKKLKDCDQPLANFLASGVLALEEKLGPLLWQLPPQLAFEADRLDTFLGALPRTFAEAAAIAARHDERVKHGVYLAPRTVGRIRHALEIRHESFLAPAALAILRRHGVALVVADTAGRWPLVDETTADFAYMRLHGARRLYAGGYGRAELDAWAERIERARRGGRDVYVYFDNDVGVRAPFDAQNLAARFGHNAPVTFPRGRLRAAEAERGIDQPRTTWSAWRRTA